MDLFCIRTRLRVFGPLVFVLSLVLQLVSGFPLLRAQCCGAGVNADRLASLPFALGTILGRPVSISVEGLPARFGGASSVLDNPQTPSTDSSEQLNSHKI